MTLKVNAYESVLTTAGEETWTALPLRRGVGYELRQLMTQFRRDAAVTDDTSHSMFLGYSTEADDPGPSFDTTQGFAVHEWAFASRKTTGTEQQVTQKEIIQPFDGLVIPHLFMKSQLIGVSVSWRFKSTVHFRLVPLDRMEYLGLLKVWGVDLDVNEPPTINQIFP